jgi:hypothetical protein
MSIRLRASDDSGKVVHRPMDGATALAAKILNQIYENRMRP